MAQGTLQVRDTLATLAALDNTVAEYGVDDAYAIIDQDLAFYGEQVNGELIPEFCATGDAREWVYGADGEMTVEELDEYGDPDVEKVGGGATMGAPLRRFGRAIGWTGDYMAVTTTAEFAKQYTTIQTADLKGIRRNIRRAFFDPFNDLTYRDKFIDRKLIKVYAFANGDGMPMPHDPNGVPFPANHNHFLAAPTLTNAAMNALYETVVEHEPKGKVCFHIARGMEDSVRALTDFTPYTKVNIVQPLTLQYAIPTDGTQYDETQLWDRAIGEFKDAVVWVKPWMFNNYVHCVDKGDGDHKPLYWRTRRNRLFADFGLRAKHVIHPLYADALARDYGITPKNREMSAVLFVGGTNYTIPVGL